MAPSSRLDQARRRVRAARYVIASIAAAGFGGGIVAAAASHPVTHRSTRVQTQATGDFSYGYSSIAPATSAPAIQSGGS